MMTDLIRILAFLFIFFAPSLSCAKIPFNLIQRCYRSLTQKMPVVEELASQITQAFEKNAEVVYVTSIKKPDGAEIPKVTQGQIVALKRNKKNAITGFVLVTESGLAIKKSIEPTGGAPAITLFSAQPKSLTEDQLALLEKMLLASQGKQYISFRTEPPNAAHKALFEGWITGVDIEPDGEYSFKVDRHGHEPGRSSYKYKLSEILPETFKLTASRYILGTNNRGEGASIHADIIDGKNKGRSVAISTHLYGRLSVFADPHEASGPNLPIELEKLVAPGSTLRLYFESDGLRVRLTILRVTDKLWLFGNTDLDGLELGNNEDLYTISENQQLASGSVKNHLPAAMLREHLHPIYYHFLNNALKNSFGFMYKTWKNAIAENINNPQVLRILLHTTGEGYSLNQGFVMRQTPPLTKSQTKLRAAINYLIDNEMTFQNGIISPQGAPRPRRPGAISASTASSQEDFGQELFTALEDKGMKYSESNEKWVAR